MSTSPAQSIKAPRLSKFVGFAITTKPKEAKKFYSEKLGFRFIRDDGFAVVFDAYGTMLRMSKLREFTPAQYTVLGWEVEDIVRAVKGLNERGVNSLADRSCERSQCPVILKRFFESNDKIT